jgi:hypothetical protein
VDWLNSARITWRWRGATGSRLVQCLSVIGGSRNVTFCNLFVCVVFVYSILWGICVYEVNVVVVCLYLCVNVNMCIFTFYTYLYFVDLVYPKGAGLRLYKRAPNHITWSVYLAGERAVVVP